MKAQVTTVIKAPAQSITAHMKPTKMSPLSIMKIIYPPALVIPEMYEKLIRMIVAM